MAYSSKGMFSLSNYTHLKTIPALLSIFFAMASLYLFGGVSELHFSWVDYTLTTQHALLASLGILAIAFASSETKSFAHYSDLEKVLIASGPVLMLAYQYIGFVSDLFHSNDPVLPAVGFLVTVTAWSVAVR